MADQSDVETALVSVVANALYPNGVASASALGNVCRVYRGYPSSPTLGPDLAAGVLHVTVDGGAAVKNVTRYPRKWQIVAPVPATLEVSVGPQSASFSGICAAGQLAGVAVNGAIFPYAVQVNDSPATVASNLAALLRNSGWLVDYGGVTVTIPNAQLFTARVVNGANALQEIKRQVQDFDITLWCPSPTLRDAAAALIDDAVANLQFLALADGSSARIIFAGTEAEDTSANATLYKRTLRYSAEYPTTIAQLEPAMLFGVENLSANAAFVKSFQG
jgi:hypothetical protein